MTFLPSRVGSGRVVIAAVMVDAVVVKSFLVEVNMTVELGELSFKHELP